MAYEPGTSKGSIGEPFYTAGFGRSAVLLMRTCTLTKRRHIL